MTFLPRIIKTVANCFRNVYGSNDQVDIQKLAMIVRYIRTQINKLEATTKDDVLAAKIEYDEIKKIVN